MKPYHFLFLILCLTPLTACAQQKKIDHLTEAPAVITDPGKYNLLKPEEARVILHKGTERAFSGAYHNNKKTGAYLCRQCNLPLFRSEDKFDSGTGWPSFDDMIDMNVKELPDADGQRTEIVCANCEGHLGHVFYNEGFTRKMTRHCVNAVSLSFVEKVE